MYCTSMKSHNLLHFIEEKEQQVCKSSRTLSKMSVNHVLPASASFLLTMQELRFALDIEPLSKPNSAFSMSKMYTSAFQQISGGLGGSQSERRPQKSK